MLEEISSSPGVMKMKLEPSSYLVGSSPQNIPISHQGGNRDNRYCAESSLITPHVLCYYEYCVWSHNKLRFGENCEKFLLS